MEASKVSYQEFIRSKVGASKPHGFKPLWLPDLLFDFQKHLVEWAIRQGRCALFEDCVAGETIIDSPEGNERIDVLAARGQPIKVWAWDGKRAVVTQASVPWINGVDRLYCVKLRSGRQIIASRKHRLLSSCGWKTVESLCPGEHLLVSSAFHPLSTSVSCQSVRPEDGQNSLRTVSGYSDDCSACYHLHDELLHQRVGTFQALPPLLADVRGHNIRRLCLDGLDNVPLHSRHRLSNGRHSMMDCPLPWETSSEAGGRYQVVSSGTKLPWGSGQSCLRCPELELHEQRVFGSVESFLKSRSVVSRSSYFSPCVISDTITAIYYIRTDCFYDIHVPEFGNYFANGIVSHNCGLGKTPQQLVWAENVVRKTKGNVLILTPLAVAQQTIREGDKFGIKATLTRTGQVHKGINVTNYQQLAKFYSSDFSGVVCDECFPAGTQVDSVDIDNNVVPRYIEDIRPGDKILNASGVDRVKATAKRRVDGAVIIQVRGSRITCSINHPFLTLHGWRSAKYLQAGDYLVETETAMCLVRGDFPAKVHGEQVCPFLRKVLLQQMEDVSPRTSFENTQHGDVQENIEVPFKVDEKFRSEGSCPKKALSKSEGGKRYRLDGSPSVSQVRVGRRLGTGLHNTSRCQIEGGNEERGDDLLQGRLGIAAIEVRHRSRWQQSQGFCENEGRRDKGRTIRTVRVESVEVLESDDPRLERYRDADGSLYFYDLEAERHPSFSVKGILVHNSSILKNFDGKTRRAVTDFLAKVPYRLLCTATPAPNDFMELGTSSEALGQMGRNSMLGMFFTNDGESTQQWRLKGHAKKRFWQWMATWARAVRKPSDLGYDDARFTLPPLEMVRHKLPSKPLPGFLLPRLATTLNEQRGEKRRSLEVRCQLVAEALPKKGPGLVWCQLNHEGDMLEKVVPDAVQVSGSDPDEVKEERLNDFSAGKIRVLVTKPSIACFGLNWQHCSEVAYFPTHSHEQFYQAIRRCWRFGQNNTVRCHLVYSESEGMVLSNMLRKERQSQEMYDGIVREMGEAVQKQRENNSHLKVEVPEWLV